MTNSIMIYVYPEGIGVYELAKKVCKCIKKGKRIISKNHGEMPEMAKYTESNVFSDAELALAYSVITRVGHGQCESSEFLAIETKDLDDWKDGLFIIENIVLEYAPNASIAWEPAAKDNSHQVSQMTK